MRLINADALKAQAEALYDKHLIDFYTLKVINAIIDKAPTVEDEKPYVPPMVRKYGRKRTMTSYKEL